jgi:hypothetical protein
MIEGDRGSFNLITSRGLIEEIKAAALDIIRRGGRRALRE